jgi:hypothetical protein
MGRRIVESLLESIELLFWTDVEKELEDASGVFVEHFLEVVDELVPRPYGFRDQLGERALQARPRNASD